MSSILSNTISPLVSALPDIDSRLSIQNGSNASETNMSSERAGSNTISYGPAYHPRSLSENQQTNGISGTNTSGDNVFSQNVLELIEMLIQSIQAMFQQGLQGQTKSSGTPSDRGSSTGESGLPAGNSAYSTRVPPDITSQDTGEPSYVDTRSTLSSDSSGDLHLPDSLKPFESDIREVSEQTDVPASVLAAQIWKEYRGQLPASSASEGNTTRNGQESGNNLSVSTVNGGNGLQDTGLMQVNSTTFADLQSRYPQLLGAEADPSNAHDNIMAGALYMKDQLNAYDGNMGAALRAYNSGPQNVNTNDLSDISKTGTGDATYVADVLHYADIIATGRGTLPA